MSAVPTVDAITKNVEIARQLEAAFQVYVKDISPLVFKALQNAGTKRGKNKKYEWFEYSRSRVQTTVDTLAASGYFDATPRTLNVGSTTNLLVGDTLRFETSAGVSLGDLSVYITEITDTTNVKAIKLGWTDAAVAQTSVAVFKSNLLPENSKKGSARKIRVPVSKFNYFQIFDTIVENSRTIEGSDVYGDIGKIAHIRSEAFYDIQRQLTEMLSNGISAKFNDPVSGKEIYGAGGIAEFVVNVQDESAATLVQSMLDDAVETIIKGGWLANTIRCNTKQARAISALDASKLTINLDEKIRGNVVTAVQAGIPVEGSKIETIIVDTTMPEDVIEIFDINNIALIPYSNGAIRENDATEPGQDGTTIRTLGEYTVEAKNMSKTAVKIYNLG